MKGRNETSGRLAAVATSAAASRAGLLVLGIILLSLIMRAPITAVGPIIGDIQRSLGLTAAMTGLLTTLPLLAFGLFSPLVPKAASRIGMEGMLSASALVLTAAILIRSLPGQAALFGGTALLGAAIAVANVLLPSLVKRDFPERIGLMTGIYTVAMNLGAALGSGLSVPLTEGLGLSWQSALAATALIALVAAAVWLPLLRRSGSVKAPGGAAPSTNRDSRTSAALWRSPLAWSVSLFLALQSLCFYVSVTWIPSILADKGLSPGNAGWMLSLMQLVSMLSTFVVPVLAGRQPSQRGLALLTAALFAAGYSGLWFGGTVLVVPVMIVLGLGVGGGFGLALMFFALRARTSEAAAELSGMAQAVGYLIAAAGPLLFGLMHDRTGGWDMPLMFIVIVSVLYGVLGMFAGADRKV